MGDYEADAPRPQRSRTPTPRDLANKRLHPANRLPNLKRRVDRARNFPVNTCSASRHVHLIARTLAARKPYHMLTEEPEHCAGSMLSVLESLWKARTEIAKLKAQIRALAPPDARASGAAAQESKDFPP